MAPTGFMHVLEESALGGGELSVLKIVRAAHTSCRNQCCLWYFEGHTLGTCACQMALISVQFLCVKIAIQWSFHGF